MMDHPNIARVLDAGAGDSGRPYFVMELVKGIPITKYCDENHLTTRQRLELFTSVCQAVQHAHHKGIIHRDLKPTNVLVAQYDDHPVPKIIDFGVAKALNQSLTEKTMFTQFGQIVGTLEYMSPEQARFNQLDVDTRSDIYSLGVLLYELLTGTTPFDKQRLRSSGFDEILRIIGEEEPPTSPYRIDHDSCAGGAISVWQATRPKNSAQSACYSSGAISIPREPPLSPGGVAVRPGVGMAVPVSRSHGWANSRRRGGRRRGEILGRYVAPKRAAKREDGRLPTALSDL